MADIWDSATRGFNAGVVLGERGAERAADREEREKWRGEQKERWDKQDARAQEAHDIQVEEYDSKKQFEKAKKSFNAAHALYEASEATGDKNQQRMAAKLLADTYNQHWVNGDEMKIIFRGDSAGNPELSAKWESDERLKGKEVAVLSRSGGIMPFNNLKDTFKFAASNLNMENFTAGEKLADAKVAELNAKEEPFMGKDGKYYVNSWKRGKGGMPEKGEAKPYEGVMKASKLQQDVTESETVLGRKMTPEEKRVKAGLSKPESPSERIAAAAKLAAARGEGGGKDGKGSGMTKKDLDAAKASLDILLRPFVSKGQPVLDPETGEMTQAADNGLKVAGALIDKYKEDPKSLTKEERRNLPHAVRAWEVYKSISAAVTAGHVSPEQAARMAEGEGAPVNYKDGNWHVVPSGEHKGKEARYNSEKKKFEIRARDGASASFDNSGEPAATPDRAEASPAATAGLSPPAEQPVPGREPTAAEENARRAGLVAAHAGVGREKSALENLSAEDLAAAGRAALEVVLSPAKRVKDDYEYQQARSRR
ncbi:MAG TPA: hypothetical protein PLT30_15780 [Deltaproteobacteria bacterium]|nr:hypothetical protein [Deltaproteobacteria bacterium]